jgi:hypothetical protein
MSQIGQSIAAPGATVATISGNLGGAVAPIGGNINIVGAGGITVTGNPVLHTLTITAVIPGTFLWTLNGGAAILMAVGNGYILTSAVAVIATLPPASAVGELVALVGRGVGLYTIAQAAGQVIHFDNQNTTPGAGGSLSSNNRYDCIELICVVANTEWVVRSSIGNFNVV